MGNAQLTFSIENVGRRNREQKAETRSVAEFPAQTLSPIVEKRVAPFFIALKIFFRPTLTIISFSTEKKKQHRQIFFIDIFFFFFFFNVSFAERWIMIYGSLEFNDSNKINYSKNIVLRMQSKKLYLEYLLNVNILSFDQKYQSYVKLVKRT